MLDLGTQPLANSYKSDKYEVQEEFPLAINRCTKCSHVQLTHIVNPDLMFKDYAYISGVSQTMRDHFEWFAHYSKELYELVALKPPNMILDIGCNDGSQLDQYAKLGMLTYGVDPAENLHKTSTDKGHKVTCGYFDNNYDAPCEMDIVLAQNSFAHNYDPLNFLLNIKRVMHDRSLAFIQTSQANMILNNEFDTIYHEHLSFFNIQSMYELCKRAGMTLIDVTKCPLHGTSYIFVIAKTPVFAREANIHNLIEMERLSGLYDPKTYKTYANNAYIIAKQTREYLLRTPIKKVGYGAAAKGMTFLNFSGSQLDFIIDDIPMKQGKFTPGSSIPIVSSDDAFAMLGEEPVLFVPLAWNFFEEIRNKIKSKRNNPNDTFLLYFPELKIKR